MAKIDFKKRDKSFYGGKAGRFDTLDIPPTSYLMIDGSGNPNTCKDYGQAITALYGLSYGLKFYSKTELGKDYVVLPLEGLWWANDMDAFVVRDKDKWLWTMMIRQPDWITQALLDEIRITAISKNSKKKEPPTNTATIEKVRLETLNEGLSVQTLHIGPYDNEGKILHAMHSEFIPKNNMRMTGKHHEIYLSDPRRVRPEKLKTILRQPVMLQNRKA